MSLILGIESTAHTFGIAVVKNGKVLSNVRDMYTTESGGIIPTESAKHHERVKEELYKKAIAEGKIQEKDIDAIAISQGPGLAPCLLVGMRFSKELTKKLKIPIVPVNHCVAHLEIGKITGAKDPVLLYTSGANTQIIAYASGKYRIFGETLDLGVGNFIDTFGRYAGLGFPAGQRIQELASKSKNYIELPYKVKGMDIALSGILTNLKQKIDSKKYLLALSKSIACAKKPILVHVTSFSDLPTEKQKKELLGDIDELYNVNFAEMNSFALGLERPTSGLAKTSWYYSQKDPRWGNETIGNSKSKMKDLGFGNEQLF